MSLSNRTILVVDDEAQQRDLIRKILNTEGYAVLEASDYDAALVVLQKHLGEIDLSLIDLRLPGGDGYHLAEALHEIQPGLKVLFVSGSAGAELCKFFDIAVPDVQFLQKPFQAAELLRRVKIVMEADPRAGTAAAG